MTTDDVADQQSEQACADGDNKWSYKGWWSWFRVWEWSHDYTDFAVERIRCSRPDWIWKKLPREWRGWRHVYVGNEHWNHRLGGEQAETTYPDRWPFVYPPFRWTVHRNALPGGDGKDRAYLVGHLRKVRRRYWKEWKRSAT